MSKKITKSLQFVSILGLIFTGFSLFNSSCRAQLGAVCECTNYYGAGPAIKWIACTTPQNAKEGEACTGLAADDCLYKCQVGYCANRWTELVKSCKLGPTPKKHSYP